MSLSPLTRCEHGTTVSMARGPAGFETMQLLTSPLKPGRCALFHSLHPGEALFHACVRPALFEVCSSLS